MSLEDEIPANLSCYYGGMLKKNSDDQVHYVGGAIRWIEAKPSLLFTELMNQLPISIYGHRVWYKLPFENMDELKPICNGDDNFKKLCRALVFTNSTDIFVEPDVVEDVCEQIDDEARVERNVADFVDDEYDEYATPVGSESENEEGNMRDGYLRYIKGSGELKLRQVFDSLEDFKSAVIDYVLKERWNVKYVRWEKDKSELKCAAQGELPCGEERNCCEWKIYCSYETPLQKYMVKVLNDKHSCSRSNYSKILTQEVIAKLFVNDIREDPKLMPKRIQEEIYKRWNLIASVDKCRKAKGKALEMIQTEHNEQFSRLKDYRLELLDSNVGSTVELETYTRDDGVDIFYRFYVCFDALRKAWSTYCRPIFGLDGCFLKCTTRGQLLACVGRNANDQMYPIAWAVVDIENEENWRWFLEKLQTDLSLQDGDGFAIISDRQKGLLNAVSLLFPKVEHRMCARHIYANLKKKHPHRAELKGLFWKVAKSYNMVQYEKRMEDVKKYDMNVYQSMMEKNPRNCSLAFFKPTTSCDDVSNNISEAFNHAIDPARSMPLVEMLETIRRKAMMRIDQRKKKSTNHKGKFSIRSIMKMEVEQKKITNCKVFPAGVRVYEVKDKRSSFKVYMDMQSCTCRRWDMSGIPCRHALKIISENKQNQEQYISDWFLTSRWQKAYSLNIEPVRGMNFWRKSGENKILPPPTETTQGRKRICKRTKEKNESPTKSRSKDSREKRIIHCGRCGGVGHNTRKCDNVGVGGHRPSKKTSMKNTREDGCGEEASQLNQSQVVD